jgi:hypothetical protein
VVTGCEVPYDSLVFLHRFDSLSYIYTICEAGRITVFIEPDIPVRTPEEMGPHWIVLCQDEVYVPDRIAVDKLIGVAIHPTDADSVMNDLISEFQRLELPLYDYDGNVLWPPPI